MGRAASLAVGLDPSPLRLGWAICDAATDEAIACDMICLSGTADPREIHAAVDLIARRTLALGDVTVVGVEAPFMGPNAKTALALAEVMGQSALAAAIAWPHSEIKRFTPPQWRKAVGMSGRADKAQVMARARSEGFDPASQDAADAAIIALAAAG